MSSVIKWLLTWRSLNLPQGLWLLLLVLAILGLLMAA